MKRFDLASRDGSADRKVPLQPYLIYYESSGSKDERSNERKASELPLHLFETDQMDRLKKVLFNYEWLYCKLIASSAYSVLQEFELFMNLNPGLQNDLEVKILFANLQLIRPYIDKYPKALAIELTGRLARHIGRYPLVTRLLQQCDNIGWKQCPVAPVLTCFEPADLELKKNISVRLSDPLNDSGIVICNNKLTTMFIVDYLEQGMPAISTWDLENGEKTSELVINKTKEDKDAMDIYIEAKLTKAGDASGRVIHEEVPRSPSMSIPLGRVHRDYRAIDWERDEDHPRVPPRTVLLQQLIPCHR